MTSGAVRRDGWRPASARSLAARLPGTVRTLASGLGVITAIISLRYLLPSAPGTPPNVARNAYAWPWLPVHATFAAIALLLGPIQFRRGLRARRPQLHRATGRAYALACLLGGAAGFGLALGSTAGSVAAAGFASLAIAWIYCTAVGWYSAIKGRFVEHQRWMIRSFALTFSAVTLRLQLALADTAAVDFMDGYRVIAWICWLPNLLAAEVYLTGKLRGVQHALWHRFRADREV